MIADVYSSCISHTHISRKEAYLRFVKDHGRKESTVKAYRAALGWCERELAKDGRPTEPSRIRPEDFLYLSRIRQGITEQSVRYNLDRLNAYVKWETGRELLPGLMLQWNRPQPNRRFMTKEDFRRMYELATPPQRMVLVLGAYMGLRRSEIVGIDLDDIKTDCILIRGKGHGPEGMVVRQYMPMQVREELDRYLTYRAQFADGKRRDLLVFKIGGKVNPARVCGDAVNSWVKSLGARVGIDISTHSLRRLYCTSLYNHGRGADGNGADLPAIISLTRHAGIEVLFRCYLNADPESARSCADSLNIL